MSTPIITEATIRSLTAPESFSRGEDYYHSGRVSDIERRGDTLYAEVEGSSYKPYQVTIRPGRRRHRRRQLHLSLRLGRLLQAYRGRAAHLHPQTR